MITHREARLCFSLGRPANCLGIGLLAAIAGGEPLHSALEGLGWALLAWSMFVRNAVVDWCIDEVQHPERTNRLRSLHPGHVTILYTIAAGTSVLLLLAVSHWRALWAIAVLVMLWGYSDIKRPCGFAANVLVGVCIAIVGIPFAEAHGVWGWVWVLGLSVAMIGREILKDVADRWGDRLIGRRTVALVVGVSTGLGWARALLWLGVLLNLGIGIESGSAISVATVTCAALLVATTVGQRSSLGRRELLATKIALFLLLPWGWQ